MKMKPIAAFGILATFLAAPFSYADTPPPSYTATTAVNIYSNSSKSQTTIGAASAISLSNGNFLFPLTSYQYVAAIAGSFGSSAGFPDVPDVLGIQTTHVIETQNHNGFALAYAHSSGGYVDSTANMSYYFQVSSNGSGSIPLSIFGNYTLITAVTSPFGNNPANFGVYASSAISIGGASGGGIFSQSVTNCPGPLTMCQQNGTVETVGPAQFNIFTDTLYKVTLTTSVTASSGSSALALADPYFYIDPSMAGAANYTFSFSDGVSNNPAGATGAVPEPATWAITVMGFGAVGGALRRRSKATTSVRYT